MIKILFNKISCLFGFHDVVPTVSGKYKCQHCGKNFMINDFGMVIDLKNHVSTGLNDF